MDAAIPEPTVHHIGGDLWYVTCPPPKVRLLASQKKILEDVALQPCWLTCSRFRNGRQDLILSIAVIGETRQLIYWCPLKNETADFFHVLLAVILTVVKCVFLEFHTKRGTL